MAKPNYHHARRQKELVRKTRQQEKQQKRAASKTGAEVGAGDATLTADSATVDSTTADTVGAVQPNISE